MKPLVSVIVAIYNVAPFLRQCIESITNQTLKNIEIILVNDGSTDESLQICNEYSKTDDRIKVIHQPNSGVSVARNNGILASTTDWFVMVDGDDWLENDAIEKLYNNTIEDESCDIIIGSHYENFAKSEEYVGCNVPLNTEYKYDLNLHRKKVLSYTLEEVEMPELQQLKCNLSSPWAKIYRKSFILDNNILFVPGQKRAQDEVFNLYAMQFARNIKVINTPIYHYRIWENSICRKANAKKVSLDIYRVWHEQVLIFLKKFNYTNTLNEVYELYVFNLLINILKAHVNGYILKSCNYKEAIDGIKEISQRREYASVINRFSKNKYLDVKRTIIALLWKHKIYSLVFRICQLNELKNIKKNKTKGMKINN